MGNPDFLVVGGGVIGLNVAMELKRRHGDCTVRLLEKEAHCGEHASGRNSGVLHAGFYYTADSLKARFTREGNRLLAEYCERKGLPINRCGKLVVARDEAEDRVLDELLCRARHNGIELVEVDAKTAREIEPRAVTWRRALFSPNTASVVPTAVMAALEGDARRLGVAIERGTAYVRRDGDRVITSRGPMAAGYVVNAAGLYADSVARDFGFSEQYRILPFKGLYLKGNAGAAGFRTNIYPVPDLKQPFLGVHVTLVADGGIKLGPTALPALWREQYRGLKNFRFGELLDISLRGLGLFINSDFDFKRLSITEIRKRTRRHMVALATSLAKGIRESDFRHWAPAGIRAQLLDMKKRKLEMDFVLQGDHRSMHILNAVSPGWTCSIPFSNYICDEITRSLS
ncbi:MAG: FAD-dependent oxidoreductase [Gammaproteobacteria bacterium]|nr:FAD-dependent oxidoreductase [Gammaproteobacteria bacterium]